MHTLHVLLSGAAAIGLVAAAWPHSRVAAAQAQGRLIALIACGAALIANLASMLPATPPWYDLGVALASVGALAWVVRSSMPGSAPEADSVATPVRHGAQHATRPVARVAGAAAGQRVAAGRPARSGVASAHYGDTTTTIVDAEIVEDAPAAPIAPVASLAAQRAKRLPLATQETFAQAGPAGAEATIGSTYVAAHLTDYLPQRPRTSRLARPAHEVHAARAARATRARATSAGMTGTEQAGQGTLSAAPSYADLRTHLLAAYGDGAERRGRVTSVKA